MLQQGNIQWLNALSLFPIHKMNLHYIVLFCFACLLVFNRTKAAGMWHKGSSLGKVPASRVACVSRTQTREQIGDLIQL